MSKKIYKYHNTFHKKIIVNKIYYIVYMYLIKLIKFFEKKIIKIIFCRVGIGTYYKRIFFFKCLVTYTTHFIFVQKFTHLISWN